MKNKGFWLAVAVFAVLALVFAFTDLQIAQAIYNPASNYGYLVEAYGQIPGSIVAFVCGSILLRLYKVEKKVGNIASVIGLCILVTFTSLIILADAFGAQVDAHLNVPLVFALAVLLVIVAQVALRRFPADTLAQFKPAAKVGLTLLFFAGLITVWLIKIPWGRWTYRDIVGEEGGGNLSLFSPWYLPQGNNGHHSFFSGHTAYGFVVLPIILFFKKQSRARKNAVILALLWGLIVAFGRLVYGAHFASDVLFGAGETLLWFWIFRNRFAPDA
jgi:membrane-associated phospholipid phosphatase